MITKCFNHISLLFKVLLTKFFQIMETLKTVLATNLQTFAPRGATMNLTTSSTENTPSSIPPPWKPKMATEPTIDTVHKQFQRSQMQAPKRKFLYKYVCPVTNLTRRSTWRIQHRNPGWYNQTYQGIRHWRFNRTRRSSRQYSTSCSGRFRWLGHPQHRWRQKWRLQHWRRRPQRPLTKRLGTKCNRQAQ